MSRFLFVFAKEPEPGTVKTRLRGYLGDGEILELYTAMVQDTVATSGKVRCDKVVLACLAENEPRVIMKIAPGIQIYKQTGSDLGERMHNAFMFSKEQGASSTVIIGSDAPTLPPAFIDKAFHDLSENDLVLGPSYDGGYYLIGLKEPCRELFDGIHWSGPDVLKETLSKSARTGKKTVLLEQWYDVDDSEALLRLAEHLRGGRAGDPGRHTKAVLKMIRGGMV